MRLRRERGPEAPDRGLGHQAAENRGDLQPSRHRALHASAAGRATASDRLRRATGGVQGGSSGSRRPSPRSLRGFPAGRSPSPVRSRSAGIERLVANDPVLEGRVELIGPFTKAQLADLLASSDLFVHPSRHETFGLVLAEAMSAGLPVVAPDQTGTPRVRGRRMRSTRRARRRGRYRSGDGGGRARPRTLRRRGDPSKGRRALRFRAFGARLLAIYRRVLEHPGLRGDDSCAG